MLGLQLASTKFARSVTPIARWAVRHPGPMTKTINFAEVATRLAIVVAGRFIFWVYRRILWVRSDGHRKGKGALKRGIAPDVCQKWAEFFGSQIFRPVKSR